MTVYISAFALVKSEPVSHFPVELFRNFHRYPCQIKLQVTSAADFGSRTKNITGKNSNIMPIIKGENADLKRK
jgi:hypothetical protein